MNYCHSHNLKCQLCVNYWPMSLAPTNEESAWLAEKKTVGKISLSGQVTNG